MSKTIDELKYFMYNDYKFYQVNQTEWFSYLPKYEVEIFLSIEPINSKEKEFYCIVKHYSNPIGVYIGNSMKEIWEKSKINCLLQTFVHIEETLENL